MRTAVVTLFSLSPLIAGFGCQTPGGHVSRAVIEQGTIEQHFTGPVDRTAEFDYLIYFPPDYRDTERAWPLILFLHGAGERGDNLEQVRTQGLPARLERRADVPAIVVAPQCPAGQWWRPVDVKTLLDHVVRTYPIDQDRIYLTGLSMGGTGTWLTAAEYPETFAAIAPICGRTLRLRAPPLADMPIWAFHGDADRVVPVTYSTDHVKNIAAAGNTRVKLTVFPDAGHNVWDRVYNDPAFFEWLLAQRR